MTVAALYIDARGPYPKLWCGCFDRRAPGHTCASQLVDCWDATRDARKYDGPHPVVAHPPCKHWGRLRHLAKDVVCDDCGGDGFNAEGRDCRACNGTGRVSDRDCAPRAVEQVRTFGGVLEHPAGSLLWKACGLPRPADWRDGSAQEHDKGCPQYDDSGVIDHLRHGGWECECSIRDAHGGYTIELDQCEWGHVARKRTWLYLVGVPREALEAPPFPGREPTHYASGGRTASSRQGGAVPPGMKVCSETQRRRTPPLLAEYLVRLARAAAKERA